MMEIARGDAIFWATSCVSTVFILLLLLRQRTKWVLERCGLPTVFWRPRFMSYRPFEEDQKLASTTITRMLPRMQRLQGPYGMYGTVYGISTPVVHVAHPIPAKAILNGVMQVASESSSRRRRNSLPVTHLTGASKAPAYNHFKNFCGDGVFTADGDDWKAKRAAVMHNLLKGTELSQRLEQEANHAANVFIDQIHALQKSTQDCHEDNSSVLVSNIVPLLQRATVGLIYRYITHDDPDWEPPRAVRFSDAYRSSDGEEADTESLSVASSSVDEESDRIENESLLVSYLKSIVRIRMIILAQSRSIWFVLPRWCYRYFSSLYRDEEITLGPIREFARRACDKAKPQSPLHRLSHCEGPYREKSATPSSLSRKDVINKNLLDEAITLLFAGQDTSAATLSWTLHLLSLHPEIQEKLALEVQGVLIEHTRDQSFNDNHPPLFTKKMISKMPYLDAVIKESMRLYPVAPFVVRRLMETIEIPQYKENARVSIPSGSVACIWIYGLHRNPKFWHRPDDFVPERWLNAELKDLGQTSGAYMPFASGPRNCLGQPLAHVILRTLLSKLLYMYEFIEPKLMLSGDNAHELRKDMQAGFTVLPTGGVELLVKQRDVKVKSS
ncbi:cytochrome P450 [Nitzschia inconspicua]|uniref:Cytochrome P450 n=1 Tax=Nitzschia inconspicua TaxID=303405 RepID=A0A9K3LFG9_9STRA|nr:cytochrome P450 [Nitzschia inconspicua]